MQRIILIISIVLILAVAAFATMPQTVSYKGSLKSAD